MDRKKDMDSETDIWIERQTCGQKDRHMDRKTDMDRQTDIWIERQIEGHKDGFTYKQMQREIQRGTEKSRQTDRRTDELTERRWRERERNKETERKIETMKNILRLTFGPITDNISITYPMRGKSYDEILDHIDSLSLL